jgi:tripartite-type tricarboxylate transporter receptor subunit TctC
MKRLFICLTIGVSSLMPLAAALAQNYPSKPIRLMIPFPPGGGTDMISREVGNAINKKMGWSIIPENKPGAGGNLGIDAVAKAAPDGYTIGMGQTSNLAINPALHSKLPYKPLQDLAPIALIAASPVVIVVPANSKYQTLGDMISDAKARPGLVNSASPGNGTVAHLSSELLQQVANFKTQHIPYKGFNHALNDLIGGQVDMFMSSVPTALGHIRNGKLRALAVTSLQRSSELPEVPTVAESGYPNFEAITWFGLVAPAGTPAATIKILNEQANAALQSPELSKKLQSEGAVPMGGTPEHMRTYLEQNLTMWEKVVKSSGAKVD